MRAGAARRTEVNFDPEHYDKVSTYELLEAAARGLIGLDHRFLHAIIDHRDRAIPDLVRFAAENHEDDPINLEEDLIAIFRYFTAPEAIPFYLKLIREDPHEIGDEVIDSLVHLGKAALEPLIQLHDELGEENAGDIPFVLAALHVHDPRILKILTERLEYDVGDAGLCLEVYGDPAAVPVLEKVLEGLPANEATLRREVENVIEDLSHPKPRDIEPPAPFKIWELYPETAPPAFDVLSEEDRLQMLDSASAERRKDAAGSFGNSELSERAKARMIVLARTDPDASVRGRAWESLIDESDEPEIRRGMLAIVENPKTPLEEKAGAVVGLSRHSDQQRVRQAIEDLYANPAGRAKAMEAMWRSFDPTFAAYPPKHLKDADPDTRRQAIWGVGQLGLSQSAPQLREFFDDDEYRPDALFNYALSMPAEVSRGRARGLLDKIDQLAGHLSPAETELVEMALDQRLMANGMRPFFNEDLAPDLVDEENEPVAAEKTGRNDPCPCGSGKKYKKCHGV